MRDKELAEVIASIHRCLIAITAKQGMVSRELLEDLLYLRKYVEMLGGSVE